ncbi:hypothetical protein [Reyranella sp.]|uniref:hypothetical protein n=1 Tax=Reyranella sp. TaxID=1929291 RepID=UPI003BA979BC
MTRSPAIDGVRCPSTERVRTARRSPARTQQRFRIAAMDDSSRQLLFATFAYLVFIGGLIATLGVAFGA